MGASRFTTMRIAGYPYDSVRHISLSRVMDDPRVRCTRYCDREDRESVGCPLDKGTSTSSRYVKSDRYRQARSMVVGECIRLEYRLPSHCVQCHAGRFAWDPPQEIRVIRDARVVPDPSALTHDAKSERHRGFDCTTKSLRSLRKLLVSSNGSHLKKPTTISEPSWSVILK